MEPYRAWPFLSDPSHPLLSAVWAVAIHGVLAIVVVAPLLWQARHRPALIAAAFAAGSVFDIDHFVAAGTLNLHTIETMSGGRPATHSLGVVVLLGLAVYALTRHRQLSWGVFAIFLSHLLFDAAGGADRLLYPIGGVGLLCGSLAIATRQPRVRAALGPA
jgi:membrane-bound metal-dependent hydrolase YbcI (DUF457 family)